MASSKENIKESSGTSPKDGGKDSLSQSPKGLKNFLGLSVKEMSARFDSSGDDPKGGNGADQAPSPGKNATRKMSRKTVQDRLGDLSDSEDELKGEEGKREESVKTAGAGSDGTVSEAVEGKKAAASPKKTEVRSRTRIPSPENRKSVPRETGSGGNSAENSPKTQSPKASQKSKAAPVSTPASSAPVRELTDAEIQAEVDKMYAFHDEEPDSLDFVQANEKIERGGSKEKENLKPEKKDGGETLVDLDDELESQILPEGSDTAPVQPSAPSGAPVAGNKRAGSGAEEKIPKRKMKASGDDFGSIPDLSFGLRDLSKLPVKEVPIVPTRTWVTGTKKDGEKDTGDSGKTRPRSKLPSPTRSFDETLSSPRSKSPKRKHPGPLNLPDLEQVWTEIQQTKIYMEEDIQKSSECLKALSATCGLRQSDRLSLSREYDLDVLEMPDTTLRTSQFEDLLSKLGECEDVGWDELIGTEEIEAVIADASRTSRARSPAKEQQQKDEKLKRENYELEISNLQNVVHKLKEEIISRHKATTKKDALLIKLIKAWADVRKQWKVHETRSKLIIERVQAENTQTSTRGGKRSGIEESARKSVVEQTESSKNRSKQGVKTRDTSPDKSKGSKQQDEKSSSGVEEIRAKLSAAEEKATYYQRELEQSAQQNKGLQDWLNSISKQKDNLESKIAELTEKLASEQEAKESLEKTFGAKLEKEEQEKVNQIQTEYSSKFEQHVAAYKTRVITTQTTLIEKHQQQLKEIEVGTSNIYKEHREKSVMDVLKAIQRQGQDLQQWKTEIHEEEKWNTLVSKQLSAFEKRESAFSSSTLTTGNRKTKEETKTTRSAERARGTETIKRRSATPRMSAERDASAKAVPATPPSPPKTKPASMKSNIRESPTQSKVAKPEESTRKRGKAGSIEERKISEKNVEPQVVAKKSEKLNTTSPRQRSRPGYAASTCSRDLALVKKEPKVAESQASVASTDVKKSAITSAERADRTSSRRERTTNVTRNEGSTRTARSETTKMVRSAASSQMQTESRQRAQRASRTTCSKVDKSASCGTTVASTDTTKTKTSKT